MLYLLSSRSVRITAESFVSRRHCLSKRYHGFRTVAFRASVGGGKTQSCSTTMIAGTTFFALAIASACTLTSINLHDVTHLERASIPSSGDVISAGTPVKEAATGILFPPLCNGYYLAGTGVRVKWGLIKVYAVGTYIDPLAMSAIKSNEKAIEQALLDPNYPRTIRIVMNRALSIDKYTSAIVEALTPRMNGEDLDKLDEFKALNPPVDLIQGAEIEMTIRGDTLLYKNAVGGVGSIRSSVFCRALCETYYGSDPVSPTHKDNVVAGIRKM